MLKKDEEAKEELDEKAKQKIWDFRPILSKTAIIQNEINVWRTVCPFLPF